MCAVRIVLYNMFQTETILKELKNLYNDSDEIGVRHYLNNFLFSLLFK